MPVVLPYGKARMSHVVEGTRLGYADLRAGPQTRELRELVRYRAKLVATRSD